MMGAASTCTEETEHEEERQGEGALSGAKQARPGRDDV